jgi:hypothetical protein
MVAVSSHRSRKKVLQADVGRETRPEVPALCGGG